MERMTIFTLRFLLFALLLSHCQGLDTTTSIVASSDTLDAPVGTTFEIQCDASNRRDGNEVRWQKVVKPCNVTQQVCNVRQLSLGKIPDDQQKYGLKFQPSDTYILIIKNVEASDEGTYKCTIPTTRVADATSQINVRVVAKPAIDPMVTSSDLFVTADEDVTLMCGASGIPNPNIMWTRAGNGQMPGGGFKKLGNTLKISRIQPKFRGPYICTAWNDNGEDYRTIYVDMKFAPQLTSSNTRVQQAVGYQTRITCKVDANSPAQVSWKYNNAAIDPARHQVISYASAFETVISKLTIVSVERSDYDSTYTCIGQNDVSTESLAFKIEESSDPQPVRGRIISSASTVQLSTVMSALLFAFSSIL